MATMQDIEKQTREFAKAKRELNDIMAEIATETEVLKKKYLPRIRSVMNQVTARHGDLYREIAENPALFDKPRTQTFDGVRVGLSKGKGTLQIEDPELTIKLIRKHLAEQADILIRSFEEPAKAAIKKLDEALMKKIGCSIEGKEDRVLIEETDTQINKILGSLLKFQVEELSEEYREEAA
jgi:hypothetical protein